MSQHIELLGQRISLESVFLIVLGTAVFAVIIRELVVLIFWRALLVWAGCLMSIVAFGIATVWIPSNVIALAKERKKPIPATLRFHAFASSQAQWLSEAVEIEKDTAQSISVFPESFLVSNAIDDLIENVLRDFVLSWFNEVSPNLMFPSQVELVIRQAVIQLISKLKKVEWPYFLITKLMPLVTEHFQSFIAAESAVRERSIGRDLTDNQEFQYAVAAQYCHGRMHPAISLKNYKFSDFRKSWLRQTLGQLVPQLLGPSGSSKVVTQLSQDILACSVLFPVVSLLSDPDFWNQTIVNTSGPTLRDRRKVEKLIQALNNHANNSGTSLGMKEPLSGNFVTPTLKLSPSADHGDHERFLQQIARCKSLPEARQTRYFISLQLQRSKKQGADPLYISRLQQSKRAVERRINKLSGKRSKGSLSGSTPNSRNISTVSLPDPREEYSLQQILNDPSCALCFMEFMDQRSRLVLVQFWLTVNSLKDPLQEEIDEYDEDFEDIYNYKSKSLKGSESLKDIKETDTVHANDITQIYQNYFNGSIPYVSIDAAEAVARFVKSPDQQLDSYKKARRAILQTQGIVFKAMEIRDLVKFKRSDLFLKYLAADRKISSVVPVRNKRIIPRNDVDALQLDAIEDIKEFPASPSSSRSKSVKAVEVALNSIMENGTEPILGNNGKARRNDLLFEDADLDKKRNQPLFEPIDSEISEYEDEVEEGEVGSQQDQYLSRKPSELHLAAPGDLNLTETINNLTAEINMLYRQESVLEPLIRKAELTGNTGNLRILRKSKVSLEKELQRKEVQRQQYIVQESDNSLYGRSSIHIRSYMRATDADGHNFVSYIIEVERRASDGSVSAGWVVSRRYTHFLQLHNYLRAKFSAVQKLNFPKKGMVLKFQKKSFVDARKIALQKYMGELLELPEVCRSKGFRAFLSSENFSKDSLSNSKFPSVVNVLEDAGLAGGRPNGIEKENQAVASENIVAEIKEAEAEAESATRPFVQPICEFFLQIFGLSRHSWLGGRAVVVVVQQLLGGAIEKKIRGALASVATEGNLAELIQKVTASIWPDGALKVGPAAARTKQERLKCKHDARAIVHTLIRDASIKIVGGASSRYASTHVFDMFQNEILNAHLVYTLMDALLTELFDM